MKNEFDDPLLPKFERVSFPYRGGIYFFPPDQIIRLESDSNYTYIFFNQHKPILMAKALCDYQILLEPFGFIRTHRSHLINQQHILSIDAKGEIIMDDKSKALISRRKRREIISSLAQ